MYVTLQLFTNDVALVTAVNVVPTRWKMVRVDAVK